MTQPALGDRVMFHGAVGTVLYKGPVAGTSGEWLGIDWDEGERGKHDGSKDGTRYFHCRVPGIRSGSFVRTTSVALSLGKSFVEALNDKYVDTGELDTEKVVLGSSNGAIIVEAPRLSKVRGRLADLHHLREVSFDPAVVNGPGSPLEIARICQNIRGLDMSKSLLKNWIDIAAIISQLPLLQTLVLNENRLENLDEVTMNRIVPATCLKALHLNKTLITASEMFHLAHIFPELEHLEMGHNCIFKISPHLSATFRKLKLLNLDANQLSNWTDLMQVASDLPALIHLILASNNFRDIPPITSQELLVTPYRPGVKRLSLSSNGLHSWVSVSSLTEWLPHLEGLSLQDNPLMEDIQTSKHVRPLIISCIGTLTSLNGSSITSFERKDAELFCVNHIQRIVPDRVRRAAEFPRWETLVQVYGLPVPDAGEAEIRDKLASRVIELSLLLFDQVPAMPLYRQSPGSQQPQTIRVLPTMTLKTLRLKLAKTLRHSQGMTKVDHMRVWAALQQDNELFALREMDLVLDSGKELDWWGLDTGCGLGIWLSSS